MTFKLTEDQAALRETLSRSFADSVTSEYLRAVVRGDHNGESLWQLVEELGLFEFVADSKGQSLVELTLLAHEVGRRLLPIDIVGALFFGPFLLGAQTQYYAALKESSDVEAIKNGKIKVGHGFQIDSKYIDFVPSSNATTIISLPILAKGDSTLAVNKITNGGIPHGCLDLTLHRYRYEADHVNKIDSDNILYAWMVLVASELSGIGTRVIEMTREYISTRKQFGVAIGSFQAVQQQIADAFLKTEASHSLVQFASSTYSTSQYQLGLAARSALGYAIEVIPSVVETAIQLHGGIGFTWEYDLHLFLRRARTLSSLYCFGAPDFQAILDDAVNLGAVSQVRS